MDKLEELRFLTEDDVRTLVRKHGTPIYVYSRQMLRQAASEVKQAFADVPYGLTVRYAMKANPHAQVIELFCDEGFGIDASSHYEVEDALKAGAAPTGILLTSQQPPDDFMRLLKLGVPLTATSLNQLKLFGQAAPGSKVSVRLNTGLGSGANHRLTTGGIEVGFGIWFHDEDNHGDEIRAIVKKHRLSVERLHIHIGTGSDPAIWEQLIDAGLFALSKFPEATILNLGGGFKLPYMSGETGADLAAIGAIASRKLEEFASETGRKIHFEIEPGRYLTARAGAIISTIIDKTDTGEHGDEFLRLDSGMTEIVRPAMYGARHPLIVVPKNPDATASTKKYAVIGHCCESSDLLTPTAHNPEEIEPRHLRQAAIGDYLVIEMAGAYCASFSVKGYNSFPVAKEVLVD